MARRILRNANLNSRSLNLRMLYYGVMSELNDSFALNLIGLKTMIVDPLCWRHANPTYERIQCGTDVVISHILVANNERLMAPFTREDIYHAITAIGSTKALGPDGYHALVYQDGVLRVLGLTSMTTHDKYLGLPTVIGRNKKRAFEGICEKVRKRVREWKQRRIIQLDLT
ncbi:hypothetical protein F8388_010979 [Cannabis sativa]|uniref:Uncharacterized protein n=1 Tax=Cannabis sativa TaxID=3483 RepID=A0A7J6DS73_CANSA|nr:hypothetical protein F8388_010979 [Cannabis sativa]KAF4364289.1 hypothetical protein G4B88_028409 [Cannabis sativa]